MPKFNPLDFNYELIKKDEESGIAHYQRVSIKKDAVIADIIELGQYEKTKTWMLFIKGENMLRFLPGFEDCPTISLFVGKIKNNYDFRFIMNKICKDPKILIKLGC